MELQEDVILNKCEVIVYVVWITNQQAASLNIGPMVVETEWTMYDVRVRWNGK